MRHCPNHYFEELARMRIAFASNTSTAQPKRAMLEAVTKDNFLCDVESLCSSSDPSNGDYFLPATGRSRRHAYDVPRCYQSPGHQSRSDQPEELRDER